MLSNRAVQPAGEVKSKGIQAVKVKVPLSSSFSFSKVWFSNGVILILPAILNLFATAAIGASHSDYPPTLLFCWIFYFFNIFNYKFWKNKVLLRCVYPLQSLSIPSIRHATIFNLTNGTGFLTHFFSQVDEANDIQNEWRGQRAECDKFKEDWAIFEEQLRERNLEMTFDRIQEYWGDKQRLKEIFTQLSLGYKKVVWQNDSILVTDESEDARKILESIQGRFGLEAYDADEIAKSILRKKAGEEFKVLEIAFRNAGLTLDESRQLLALQSVYEYHFGAATGTIQKDPVTGEPITVGEKPPDWVDSVKADYDYTFRYRKWLMMSVACCLVIVQFAYAAHWDEVFSVSLTGAGVVIMVLSTFISLSGIIGTGVSVSSSLETGKLPWILLDSFTEQAIQMLEDFRLNINQMELECKKLVEEGTADKYAISQYDRDYERARDEVMRQVHFKVMKRKVNNTLAYFKDADFSWNCWRRNFAYAMIEMEKLSALGSQPLALFSVFFGFININFLLYIFAQAPEEVGELVYMLVPIVIVVNLVSMSIVLQISEISTRIDNQDSNVQKLNVKYRDVLKHSYRAARIHLENEKQTFLNEVELEKNEMEFTIDNIKSEITAKAVGFFVYGWKVARDIHVKVLLVLALLIPLEVARTVLVIRARSDNGLAWI
eukprot:GFYU01001863.1.p1 GENE.GFYU01001863.1~~GFYU01001863.1.p1  ORF type:complete len:661 (+),score=175.19 GFYU01001863.1:190-2172(+)